MAQMTFLNQLSHSYIYCISFLYNVFLVFYLSYTVLYIVTVHINLC